MIRKISERYNPDLSFEVVEEILSTGDTSVICPYCKVKPEFDFVYTPVSKRLERIVGGCECGYIRHTVVSLYIGDTDENKDFANGYRKLSKEPLSEGEIRMVIEAAKSIGIPIEILVFNDERYLSSLNGTCYNFVDDKIYITQNVFPDEHYSSHPRDQLSVRAVLAHEYYGHRPFRDEYIYDYDNNTQTKPYWEDEVRASIEAARFTPNLSQLERAILINEARQRAAEFSHNLELDDYMKNILFGDGTAKPIAIPINLGEEFDADLNFKQTLLKLYGIDLYELQTNQDIDEEPDI